MNTEKASSSSVPVLNWQWQTFQWGLGLFFLFPSLGAVLLGITMLGTIGQMWSRWRQQFITKFWGIVFILMLAGSAVSIAPRQAIYGMANIIPFGLFVTAIACLLRTPEQLRRMSQILVLSSVPLLVMGMAQMLVGWSTPEWWSTVTGWSVVAGGNPAGRMASGLMYANLYACYLAVILMLTLGLWFERYDQWHSQPLPRLLWPLIALTLLILGNGAGLFLTQSRNAWGLAIAGLMGFGLYLRWYWPVGAIASFAGVVAWASWLPAWGGTALRSVIPFAIWGRLSGDMFPIRPPETLRPTQWQFCWHLIQERPWTGWGLRSFESLFNTGEHAATYVQWIYHPHNLFLMLTAELGIPLTVGLFVWVAWCCYPLVRRWSKFPQHDRLLFLSYLLSFGCILLFNSLDISLFDLRTNLLGWLLLTAIAGIGRGNQQDLKS